MYQFLSATEHEAQRYADAWAKFQNTAQPEVSAMAGDLEAQASRVGARVEGGTGTVNLTGFLAPTPSFFLSMFGGTAVSDFASVVRHMANDDKVKTIVLNIDSNGGSVQGLSDAAAAVREARERKNVIAYVSGNMNSAAYFIGSAAKKVFITADSIVGSIGTVASIASVAERNRAEGIDVRVIRSTPLKANPNQNEPITEAGIDQIQTMVNSFADIFIKNVSLNRNINQQTAIKMADGTTKVGAEAVEANLVDAVASIEDVKAAIMEGNEVAAQLENALAQVETLVTARDEQIGLVTAANAQVAELTARLEAVEVEKEQATKAAFEASATAAVEAAIEAGKFAPASKDDLVKNIVEGNMSLEVFNTLAASAQGAAVPTVEAITEATENKQADTSLVPTNDIEARFFKQAGLTK